MSGVSLVESIDSVGLAQPFYSGGEVQVDNSLGFIYAIFNGGVSIVNPASGQNHSHIAGDNDPVFTFAVNPRVSGELVTVGQSLLCRHWSVSSSGEATMLRAWSSGHLHTVSSIAISHDGSLVATAGVDKSIRVFSLPGYFPVAVYKVKMTEPISVLKFHPTRLLLFSTGAENAVSVWDLERPSQLTPMKELTGHMSTIQTIAFSKDGTSVMTSGNDQVVNTWDLCAYPKEISLRSQVAVFESVQCVLPLSSSSFITVGDKGLLRLWKDRKMVFSTESGHSAKGQMRFVLSLLEEGSILAVGHDLAMSIWKLSADGVLVEFDRQLAGNLGEVVSVKYFPGNSSRIAVAVNDEFPRIIETGNFGIETKLVGHTDICLAVSISDKGDFIATASKDQTARVWSGTTFACIATLKGHTEAVTAVAFTHTSETRLVTGSEDCGVKLWRILGKKAGAIRSIVAHTKAVNTVLVSRNDRFIATGSQDRTAKVFNLDDGSLVGVCSGHKRGVWSVDFSPIEQILATASGDCSVKLWNMAVPGLPCIRTFEGHEQAVLHSRFLPNGLQLLSADAWGTLRLWNLRSGECGLVALGNGETVVNSHLEAGVSKKSIAASIATAVEEATESGAANRIWSFDLKLVEGKKLTVVSGTAAGQLCCWVDSTEARIEQRQSDLATRASKDTSIQILAKAGRFTDAFRQAFELGRPKQMLEVLQSANWAGSSVNVRSFVSGQSEAGQKKLLQIVADWQKSARNSAIAYQLVRAMDTCEASSQFDKTVFAGFAEKHIGRLSNLAQKCFVIDAILLASNASIDKKPRLS